MLMGLPSGVLPETRDGVPGCASRRGVRPRYVYGCTHATRLRDTEASMNRTSATAERCLQPDCPLARPSPSSTIWHRASALRRSRSPAISETPVFSIMAQEPMAALREAMHAPPWQPLRSVSFDPRFDPPGSRTGQHRGRPTAPANPPSLRSTLLSSTASRPSSPRPPSPSPSVAASRRPNVPSDPSLRLDCLSLGS